MKLTSKKLTVLLATLGLAAGGFALNAYADHDGMSHEGCHQHGKFDPEKRAEFFQKKMTDLHGKLNLSAAQDPAWKKFTTAMQPPADEQRPDKSTMDKLTTPERLDRMQTHMAEHQQRMQQRNAAVKEFYGQLSDSQRKVFDENFMRHDRRDGGRDGGRDHGGKPDGRDRDHDKPAK